MAAFRIPIVHREDNLRERPFLAIVYRAIRAIFEHRE